MTRLFQRRAKVAIAVPTGETLNTYSANVYEVELLRFSFKVTKNLRKEPNTASIIVTNLSEQTRAELQGKVLRVALQAGYGDDTAVIFLGDSRDVDHDQKGADWETKIECGDGERGLRHGRVSDSFKAGTPVASVVRKFADSMGVDVRFAAGFLSELTGKQYVSGYAAHGRASRELDRVLKGLGYEWSIQDNQLQILKPGASTTELAVELTPETGLIGSPAMSSPEKKGQKPVIRARSLLQPGIRPGRRVVIRSSAHDGVFRVTKVTHTGDTAGGDFYSDLEGEPA